MTLPVQDPPNTKSKQFLKPRDAASIVLIDSSTATPRVLMGKRRADQIFLPNKYVFPGGRVDQIDGAMQSADDLDPRQLTALSLRVPARYGPTRARACALAAIRELFEETGLIIGKPAAPEREFHSVPLPWRPFVNTGFLPRIAPLRFFARAITPPNRPRRYDTRFFTADASLIVHHTGILDNELSEVGWYSLEEIQQLDVASITRHIVKDIAQLLTPSTGDHTTPDAVPFYRHIRGRFSRTLLHTPTGEQP